MSMWKKNLGTSLTAGGTAMLGVGLVPQLTGLPPKVLTVVAATGFLLMVAGTIFSHLFSADASAAIAQNATEIATVRANVIPPLSTVGYANNQLAGTPDYPTQSHPNTP